MKFIAITLAILLTACVVPTNEGGDNAPDVEQAPPHDAAVVVAEKSLVDDAINECIGLCVTHYYMSCQHTTSTEWFAHCINRCHEIPGQYWDIGGLSCMGAIADWQECQQMNGWICAGGWPYLWDERCAWERYQYEYQCILDPLPPEGPL